MAIFWCVTWIGHLFFEFLNFRPPHFLPHTCDHMLNHRLSHQGSFWNASSSPPCFIFSLCWFASSWDADDVVWLLCQTSRSVFDCWLITKLRVRLDWSRSKSIFTLGKNEGKILTQTVSTCASLAHFLSVLLKVCTSCWSDFCWTVGCHGPVRCSTNFFHSFECARLDSATAQIFTPNSSSSAARKAQEDTVHSDSCLSCDMWIIRAKWTARQQQQLSSEHFKLNFLIFPRILLSSVVFRSLIHTERVDAGWEMQSEEWRCRRCCCDSTHFFFLSSVATLGVVVFFFGFPKSQPKEPREVKRRKKSKQKRNNISNQTSITISPRRRGEYGHGWVREQSKSMYTGQRRRRPSRMGEKGRRRRRRSNQ